MLVKGVLLLAIIGINFTSVFCITADAECVTHQDNEIFKCADLKTVVIYGGELKCPNGTICNANYKSTLPETTSTDKECQPCIRTADVCGDTGGVQSFECNPDDTEAKMNGVTFTCPKGTKCNKSKESSCELCIVEKCEPKWQCDENDPHKVLQGDMEGICKAPSVCNKDFLSPCGPCITVDSLPKESTTTTTTTPTTDPDTSTTCTTTEISTITTTTTDPETSTTTEISTTTTTTPTTDPETSTATEISTKLTPSTTSETTSSSATPTKPTTTTTTTTTTTAPPFKIPNCNDSQGATNPCRPGPNGGAYYYKCKYYSPVWYKYEIKYCREIKKDPQCSGKVC